MGKTKVLFLCTGNSARNQKAEGVLRHLAGERFEVMSAGTQPAGMKPLAVEVMKEIGIDISGHRSEDVSEFLGQHFSNVITVCDKAKETCPVYPFAFHTLHWSVDDPAAVEGSEEERREAFRRARREIERHIHELVACAP